MWNVWAGSVRRRSGDICSVYRPTKAGLRRWGKGSLLVQWIWVISHGGVCLTHHTPFLLLVALLRQAQDEQCSNIETLADLYY